MAPIFPMKMNKEKGIQSTNATCDKNCAWLLAKGRCAITQIAITLSEHKK